MSETGRWATVDVSTAQLQHRNVRCVECGAMHWVARNISVLMCGQCDKPIQLAARG